MATEISGSTGVNKIQDGTITNADIASGAAIAGTKLVMPTGSVLQVVEYAYTGSTAMTSSTYISMFGTSITPSSTSSKILVMANVASMYMNHTAVAQHDWSILRGTSTCTGANTHFHTETGREQTGQGERFPLSMYILDEPSTTNSVTYNVAAKRRSGNGNMWINDSSGTSTIVLMEIAG